MATPASRLKGGFASGVANTAAENRARAEEQRQFKMEQTMEAAMASLEHTMKGIESAHSMVAELGINAGLVGQNHPDATLSPEVAQMRESASSAMLMAVNQIASFSAAMEQSGVNVPGLPDPTALYERGMAVFDSGMKVGLSNSPAQLGRRKAEEIENQRAALAAVKDQFGNPVYSDAEINELIGASPPGSVVTINDSREKAFESAVGEDEAARISELNAAGQIARGQINQLAQFRQGLNNFETGILSDTRVWLGQMFEFMGIAPPEKLAGTEAAEVMDAASNQMAIELAKSMSRVTNLTIEKITQSLPNLTRTVEGNALIVEIMERTARRAIEVSRLADSFKNKGGTTPEGEPSLDDLIDDLDKEAPVFDEYLQARVAALAKGAPTSWGVFDDFISPFQDTRPPDVPDGWTYQGKKDGFTYWLTEDGQKKRRRAEPRAAEPEAE